MISSNNGITRRLTCKQALKDGAYLAPNTDADACHYMESLRSPHYFSASMANLTEWPIPKESLGAMPTACRPLASHRPPGAEDQSQRPSPHTLCMTCSEPSMVLYTDETTPSTTIVPVNVSWVNDAPLADGFCRNNPVQPGKSGRVVHSPHAVPCLHSSGIYSQPVTPCTTAFRAAPCPLLLPAQEDVVVWRCGDCISQGSGIGDEAEVSVRDKMRRMHRLGEKVRFPNWALESTLSPTRKWSIGRLTMPSAVAS